MVVLLCGATHRPWLAFVLAWRWCGCGCAAAEAEEEDEEVDEEEEEVEEESRLGDESDAAKRGFGDGTDADDDDGPSWGRCRSSVDEVCCDALTVSALVTCAGALDKRSSRSMPISRGSACFA